MAILDQYEILFVDSQSYAVSGNTGGRMILISWQYDQPKSRDSLDKPVPCHVIFYERDNSDLQRRIVVEFKQAMELLDKRYRDSLPAQGQINIARL